MFGATNSWEKWNFSHEDDNFYDDSDSYGPPHGDVSVKSVKVISRRQEQQHQQQFATNSSSSSVSPTHLYGNSSPTNEQSVNFNNVFEMPNNNHANSKVHASNRNPAGLPISNNNNVAGGIPNIRHHPYYRDQLIQNQYPTGENFMSAITPTTQFPQVQQQSHYQLQPFYQSTQTHQYQQQQQQQHPHLISQFCNRPPIVMPPSTQNAYQMMTASAPCQGNQPWTYAYCYGYASSSQEPCQFTQFVDIEDFM